jgi:hypothetical protein
MFPEYINKLSESGMVSLDPIVNDKILGTEIIWM